MTLCEAVATVGIICFLVGTLGFLGSDKTRRRGRAVEGAWVNVGLVVIGVFSIAMALYSEYISIGPSGPMSLRAALHLPEDAQAMAPLHRLHTAKRSIQQQY